MKHFSIIAFVLCCVVFKNKAQNLVTNSSFEQHIDCNVFRIENAAGWCSACNGTNAGYLNPCMSYSYAQSPLQYLDACFQSYQMPRTGIAYAEFGISLGAQQESSHPMIQMSDTLQAGKTYCVTYYISMWNNAKYSFDKLGALLTPTPFPCFVSGMGTPTVAIAGLYNPQVVTTPGVVFEDTLGWEEVSGTFTAVGNEVYLTLGDFFLHSQHLIKNSYPTNCNGLAEYYVDDVSVEEVEIAKAKNDTLIMQGDSVIIGNNLNEAALFSWQPTAGLNCTNCPNPKASPTITTTYTVTKTQCKSVTSDVITVTVSPTGINELTINNTITLLPNPTNAIVTINSKFDMQQVEIINLAGQILLQENVNSKTHQLQLQSFAYGIYFVKVSYSNGLSTTKKIVVNH